MSLRPPAWDPAPILPAEIVTLICEYLINEDNKNVLESKIPSNLLNFCLISKAFNPTGTRFLYRTLFIGPRAPSLEWIHYDKEGTGYRDRSYDIPRIISKLLRSSNKFPNEYVKELTITSHFKGTDVSYILLKGSNVNYTLRNKRAKISGGESTNESIEEDILVKLIKALPNLRRLRLEKPMKLGSKLVKTINNHPSNIEVELLGEYGYHRGLHGTTTFPWVSRIHARVEQRTKSDEISPFLDELYVLIMQCPNLTNLSIDLDPYDIPGYDGSPLISPVYDDAQFPPIQSLYLNSTNIFTSQMSRVWFNHFQYDILQSLDIGPRFEDRRMVLGLIKQGRLPQLTKFRLSQDFDTYDPAMEIDSTIPSMASLRSLEVINCSWRVGSLVRLPQLERLLLHHSEPWFLDWPGVWSGPSPWNRVCIPVEWLRLIDSRCPNIRSLELDAQRQGEDWPWDILNYFTTGFANLEELTLHFELRGMHDLDARKPALNYDSVHLISCYFYARRIPGKFQKLTLKTGDSQATDRHGVPGMEQRIYASTYDLFPPVRPWARPIFKHVEKEVGPGVVPSKLGLATSEQVMVRIDQAVEGLPPGQSMSYHQDLYKDSLPTT